jgi:hypothetical protein
MKNSLFLLLLIFNSCTSHAYNKLTIIDNSMDPNISFEQLELGDIRGDIGVRYYNNKDIQLRVSSYYRYNKYKNVAWLFKNWGVPDKIEKSHEVTYYIFDKKSRSAPNYNKQYDEGESPVRVGYKDGRIVYISALKHNCPSKWKGPNYTLPN